jgi:hypothetical protein
MINQKKISNIMAEKKKPAPKRTVKKKATASELSDIKGIDPSRLENTLQIEDLIKQAFLRFYNTAYTNKAKEKDLDHLNLIMEEYLNCYMVLGYDLNGEKVCIMSAKNASDRDALIEHLRSTLVGILNQ